MVISRQNSTLTGSFGPELALPSSYLKLFLQQLIQNPDDQIALLKVAGLEPDQLDQPKLPLADVIALINAFDRGQPPGWHIRLCLQMEPAQHGPVGLAAISAATVADALLVIERFERLRVPWTRARLFRDGQYQILEVHRHQLLPERAALLMEMNMLALVGLIGQLLGQHRSELIFETPDAENDWHKTLVDALPGPLITAGRRLALKIPAQRLSQPCLLADRELHELMLHRCQRLLRDPQERCISARVRSHLLEASGQNPGLARIAQALGLSERSLSRHLAQEKTSYRKLVDESRLEIAQELLRFSRLPISDIAARLGYADPANFNRAYRRWTGQSPGTARRSSDQEQQA